MRPKCLCFLFLGPKGLEHIRTYPEVLKKKTEMKLALASFPKKPEANVFTSNIMEELFVCSYMFTICGKTDVKYAMLVAAYENVLDNPEFLHEFFVKFVSDYTENQRLTFKDITNDLPDIYSKIRQTYLRTKVSGKVTIEISTSELKKEKKDDVAEVINDIWIEDIENSEEEYYE
ncbi:MAG: hypothetical protein FK730_02580 [Asgard group archaeon]|nr:hypothetical protein [Asgard group archaeon]